MVQWLGVPCPGRCKSLGCWATAALYVPRGNREATGSELSLTGQPGWRILPPSWGTASLGRFGVSWRKWLVRLVVFTATSLLGAGYVVYQRATNDVAVRELVLERLHQEFTDVNATLESAQLRLLRGIAINDLTLQRYYV